MAIGSAISVPDSLPIGGNAQVHALHALSTWRCTTCLTVCGSMLTDLLAALLTAHAHLQGTITMALLCIIKAPVSLKKAHFGDSLIWCGWQFCFATQTVHLSRDKLARLCAQLKAFLHSKQAQRKELERCLGLMM